MAEGGSNFWKIALGVGCGVVLAVLALLGMCTAIVGKVAVDASEQMEKQKSEKHQALASLEIRDVKGEREYGYLKIRGRVQNGGTAPVRFVKVEAQFTDKAGNVIDKDFTYAVSSEPLNPGESKTFEIMQRANSSIDSFTVHVVTGDE
jgi:hypothetical protein